MGPPLKKYNLEEFLIEANSGQENHAFLNAIMCFKQGIQNRLIDKTFMYKLVDNGVVSNDIELLNFINMNYENDELYKFFLTCLKTDYLLNLDDFLYEIAEKKYDIFLRFLEGDSFHQLNYEISEKDMQMLSQEWQIYQSRMNEIVSNFHKEISETNETFFSTTKNIIKNDRLSSNLRKIWVNNVLKVFDMFKENLANTRHEMGSIISKESSEIGYKLETQILVDYNFSENNFCIKRIKEHRANIELIFNTIKNI